MLRSVIEAGPVVLQLEIDRRSDPINGRVTDASGLVFPFRGWLGLAAAIERAAVLDGAAPGDHEA